MGVAAVFIPISVALSTFGAANGSCFTGGRYTILGSRNCQRIKTLYSLQNKLNFKAFIREYCKPTWSYVKSSGLKTRTIFWYSTFTLYVGLTCINGSKYQILATWRYCYLYRQITQTLHNKNETWFLVACYGLRVLSFFHRITLFVD